MQNHFFNIPFNGSSAKDLIFDKINCQIDEHLYQKMNEDDIPVLYNLVHKCIYTLVKSDDKKRPIVLSPDYAISSATCTALAEKYMEISEENGKTKYISPLHVIYLTSTAHMDELTNISAIDFTKSILSDILAENDVSYTNHHFVIQPEQIILMGLNDVMIENIDIEKLNAHNIKYFTLSQLRKKKVDNICNHIKGIVGENPVHIIYDMSVISTIFAPNVFRFISKEKDMEKQLDGLSDDDMKTIFKSFKSLNIVGLDITGFNIKKETLKKSLDATIDCAKLSFILIGLMKEKKVNVFGTNTKFLIFRPIKKQNKDDDGWHLLRGVPVSLQEELIRKLELSDDDVIIFNTGDEDVYIALTTIEEQEKKSYCMAESIFDCVLTPQEKINMAFNFLI